MYFIDEIGYVLFPKTLPRLGLSWWGGLRAPVAPTAMLPGVLYSRQGHPCSTGRKVGAGTKSDPTGLPGWGLGRGLITLSRKRKIIITETKGPMCQEA